MKGEGIEIRRGEEGEEWGLGVRQNGTWVRFFENGSDGAPRRAAAHFGTFSSRRGLGFVLREIELRVVGQPLGPWESGEAIWFSKNWPRFCARSLPVSGGGAPLGAGTRSGI